MEQIAVIWRETFADEMTGRRQAFLGWVDIVRRDIGMVLKFS
ncbi:hypothetical protein NC651_037560 [Populus alba x Populus x berolinensis]|nr:hypothetical protein NC651_037560 [Populus alba x Populus x berolinensis]